MFDREAGEARQRYVVRSGYQGQFDECSLRFTSVDYADVTGDGVQDAIINLHGSASPVLEGQRDVTTVFTAGPAGPVNHGYIDGPSFPPYPDGAGVTVWLPHPVGSEGLCCPSQYEKDRYTYSSATGKFVKAETAYVPTSELPKR